jgi:hypothetical protein
MLEFHEIWQSYYPCPAKATPLFFSNTSISVDFRPQNFAPNGPQIQSQRPRKPMVTCALFDPGVLFSGSSIPRNVAILLVGNTRGSFRRGWAHYFREKIALDLPQDVVKACVNFGDASYYRDRIHSEQTNKQTILVTRKKKRSCDIHELSSFLLEQLPRNNWHLLVSLCNHSFATGFLPKKFKEVRMIPSAKKDSICAPNQTRSISLLDSFLKVQKDCFCTHVDFAKY